MRFDEWAVTGFDRDAATAMYRRGINPLSAVFMCTRGITEFEDAIDYITDKPSDIFDPFLLNDIDKAVARIEQALQRHEKIIVFGDYDVDGMTASALMKSYLDGRGADCEIYIPGRVEEGYGLNFSALDYLSGIGTNLIITVDCGITALEEAQRAKELGIDLVITDHHECRETLPEAAAVVNPKRPDSSYPNRTLAGVGVAFKVVCALEHGKSTAELLREYSDFVALGTVADVMPVTGENRAMIRAGLQKLSKNPRPGLAVLMKSCGATPGTLNSAALGFTLAPRLNAAGRMGNTSLAVDILLTDDPKESGRLTEELNKLNMQRRELEGEIFAEVEARLEGQTVEAPVVLAGDKWFQGVMGIVAARTAERWMRPAVMINIGEDGLGRGSCRSYGGFKLCSALQKCSDLLLNYGGHEMAAGVTVERDKIDLLRERLAEIYHEEILVKPKSSLYIDFEVHKGKLLELQNVEALWRLEPFGNGNNPPHLMICGARVTLLTSVGTGKHTRLRVEQGRTSFDCIYFGVEAEMLGFTQGDYIDIAFEPHINEFRGHRSVQLHVMDIRAHNPDA